MRTAVAVVVMALLLAACGEEDIDFPGAADDATATPSDEATATPTTSGTTATPTETPDEDDSDI